MRDVARHANDLEKYFVERANAGDIEGLVALYEKHAVLVTESGERISGTTELLDYFARYVSARPSLNASVQSEAVECGDLALTSSQHSDGSFSAEVARRQPDGSWLWILDRFRIDS